MSYFELIRMLILSTAVCATTVLSASFGTPLYDTSDPVQVLDNENFHRELRKTPGAYVVQFYNSWCGHCIRFAPTFKAFGADVSGWHGAVEVGVINCADDINGQVCRDNDIRGFPTIKLFWIEKGGKGSTNGTIIESRTPADIAKDVVDFVEQKIKDRGAPHDFPNLAPSSAEDLQGIWESVPSNLQQAFAVVEAPDSYVGRELALDFSRIERAAIVRVLRGSGPAELRNRDSTSLVLLEKELHPRLIAFERDVTKARGIFKDELRKLGFEFGKKQPTTTSTKAPHVIIGNYSRLYLDDIEAGIVYTLKQEVPLKQEIGPRQLSILKSFLQLIYENIDLPPRIRSYLENLSKGINVSTALKGAEFSKLLKSAETQTAYLSPDADFIGCRGSIPGKRGYTCSLWTILHYITAGNHGRYLAKEIADPNPAVLVIRDYIKNFFSCSECRDHFSQMATNLESELTNPNESVLWLWRSHNKVNARLKGDTTEDPERPKLQFPPASLCQECNAGDKFNELAVLQFLRRFYSKGNVVQSVHSRTTETTAERFTDAGNTKFFSGFDLTIFLVIYAVSITLLFLVFVAMVCRRRKDGDCSLSRTVDDSAENIIFKL